MRWIRKVTFKQLIIYIVAAFVGSKILAYWLADFLFTVLPLTTEHQAISLFWLIHNTGVFLEISILAAIAWLIGKLLVETFGTRKETSNT